MLSLRSVWQRNFRASLTLLWELLRDGLQLVTAALSQVKSPYPHSAVNPNQITQSLIAVLVGLRVPFACTETHEMGEEILASNLYQVHL
jgi:hypothetical protein